jgi:hypothetical protein
LYQEVQQYMTSRSQDRLTQWILLLLFPLNWFFIFRGLLLIEGLDGGFVAKAAATLIATAIAIAIFFFWHRLFETLPRLRTSRARALTLALAFGIGGPLLLGASAHIMATSIAGAEAMNVDMEYNITELEHVTASRYEQTGQLKALQTDLTVALGHFDAEKDSESKGGILTGAGGGGAVVAAITQIERQLADLQKAVIDKQHENDALLLDAQASLKALRETAIKTTDPNERMRSARTIGDGLHGTLLRMDVRPLAATVSRTLTSFEASVSENFKLSANPSIAHQQKDSIVRLRSEVVSVTQKLARASAELASGSVAEVPEFRASTPMAAMLRRAFDFSSVWCAALLIDLAPLLPLLFGFIAITEKTSEETASEEMANLTLHELVLLLGALKQVRSDPLDERAVKALVAEHYGRRGQK